MGAKNNKGQILVEVGVVTIFVLLVVFAAINQLSGLKSSYRKNQLTQERGSYENKASTSRKK